MEWHFTAEKWEIEKTFDISIPSTYHKYFFHRIPSKMCMLHVDEQHHLFAQPEKPVRD